MPNRLTLTGTTLATLLCMQPDSILSTRQAQVEAAFEGLIGEKHSGFTRLSDSRTPWYTRGTPIRNDRQVTILSVEEMAVAAHNLGVAEILPEWIGTNLLLAGIPRLSKLPPMTRMLFASGAVLTVTAENNPCKIAGSSIAAALGRPEITTAYPKAAIGLRGLVAVVELPGFICPGDSVRVEVPQHVDYVIESGKG